MKLTRAHAREIASRYGLGERAKVLAYEFNVTESYIRRIASRCGVRKNLPRSKALVNETVVSQTAVPIGCRRLLSGKVIPYSDPEMWLRDPPGSRNGVHR